MLIGIGLIAVAAASPAAARALFGRVGAGQRTVLLLSPDDVDRGVAAGDDPDLDDEPRAQAKRFSIGGALIFLVLLAVVPFIGAEKNGAVRWIELGVGQLQPSEFLKPFFVVTLAWLLSLKEKDKKLPVFLVSAVLTAIVAVLPDEAARLRLDHHLRHGVDRDAGAGRAQLQILASLARRRWSGSCWPISSMTWRQSGSTASCSARATISRSRMRCAR